MFFVAAIFRVNSNGGIAQHRFGTRGCNGNELRASHNRVVDGPELSRCRFVNDLEIGNGRFASRAPVDNIFAAIDEPFLVQANEHFVDGAR